MKFDFKMATGIAVGLALFSVIRYGVGKVSPAAKNILT